MLCSAVKLTCPKRWAVMSLNCWTLKNPIAIARTSWYFYVPSRTHIVLNHHPISCHLTRMFSTQVQLLDYDKFPFIKLLLRNRLKIVWCMKVFFSHFFYCYIWLLPNSIDYYYLSIMTFSNYCNLFIILACACSRRQRERNNWDRNVGEPQAPTHSWGFLRLFAEFICLVLLI